MTLALKSIEGYQEEDISKKFSLADKTKFQTHKCLEVEN
jgi:hypothetical protein